MIPIETELERRLRSDLAHRRADVPPAPADLADLVRRRHRSQRRAQLLTAGAAVAVVAVFAGASALLGGPPVAGGADPAASPSQGPALTLLESPTRGSLADDEAWVDDVRRLDWEIPEQTDPLPDPSILDRHVAFAGDVPDGRVALVLGTDDGRTAAAWFLGPEGASPEDMALVETPREVSPRALLALMRTATPTAQEGVLVVVTLPGWSVEVTRPAVVDAEGRESTDEVDLPVEDGIVATRLDHGLVSGTPLRTRPEGRMAAPVLVTAAVYDDPGVVIGPDGLDEQSLVDDTIEQLLARYDLDAASARPTVLVRGDGVDGERVLLIGLTFPSGATGTWLLTYEAMPDAGYESLLSRLPHAAAGTALEDRLVSAPVEASRLAVHAPAGATEVEVLTADGRVLGAVPLTDGGYVGEVPGGSFAPSTGGAAALRALDADGGVAAEGPIGRLVNG